ncbi:type II secretion system F family protein [Evansella sp. LMS18]|jgi:tight adherence protein C|uniref:type II secretion system F family protein n=1 Tax=Evansella sp. LMS18 TaxID=2924033 RepID=UPI0020D13533|nr:type II secretion system F family protein [Evansella sp. LMS18]UTR12320.1 type II secretion system F family protein [Evansella sp. LMS18]
MIVLMYGFTVLLLLYGMLLLKKEKKKQVSARLATVFNETAEETVPAGTPGEDIKKISFFSRIIKPLWKETRKSLQKNLTSEKREILEQKLLQAGSPFGMTPVEFRIVQIVMLVLLPLLAGGYALLTNAEPGRILMFTAGGFAAGKYLPSFYLKQKAKARNKEALKALPDFIDLLTVSMEAGLGFDSALSKVTAKKEGVLSSEFQRCLEEMRLGKTRKEALSGVRQRLELEDVNSLIGSIIQAEQLGIGMVQVLNVQANEIRGRRKQRAEETAMKAPIKMLFPLVLFIFPCIFIVILGPAIIQIVEVFE